MNIPVEPTPFGKALGLPLGKFDPEAKSYTVEFKPCRDTQVNFVPTVHGGLLAAIFDDCAGMLIYSLYGKNSAITLTTSMQFLNFQRAGQTLRCQVRIYYEAGGKIWVSGDFYSGDKIKANGFSLWQTVGTK